MNRLFARERRAGENNYVDASIFMKFLISIVVLLISVTIVPAQVGTLEPTLRLVPVSDITIPYQNGVPLPSFEKQYRTTISLSGQWKKSRFNANHSLTLAKRDSAGYAQLITEANGRHTQYYNDAPWTEKTIPGVENTLNANETPPEFYQDGVWYRKKFTVADTLQQFSARLNFYAVNYVADVWLNGIYLGWHEGGYTPFSFDVSSALRYDSANVLAVRVDNVPWGTRKDIVPYVESDWFNYTGIIHDVYLEFSNKISVVRADVVTKNISGLVEATLVINNNRATAGAVDVALRVFAAKNDSLSLTKEISAELAGQEVQLQGTAFQALNIPTDSIAVWRTQLNIQDPKLWSPKNPNLYILKATVSENGVVKDEFYTQFGIRTVKTVDDKIFLNDKPAFLHGVARHEDHPSYGRSIPASVIFSDLQIVKRVNANYLRTAHYPNHPFTYLAADRLGLLIMEEIPVWWFDETFPWLIQNSVRMIHRQMFSEMAFRDRNRPSIALWSLSNECRDVPGRISFYQSVRSELETLYPDGRLITQSAAADRPGPYDESQSYCDVAGWTMYFGIFYNPSNHGKYRGTKYFTIDAHDYFPKKPIIATEFGYWSGESMSQFALQTETFDSTFLAFEPRIPISKEGKYNPAGFIAGVTWWCIFDWYRISNGFQSMGLMRMNRDVEKPVFAAVQSKYGQFVDKSEYITGVERTAKTAIPTKYSLSQNFPNPFNPSTTFKIGIPSAGTVSLSVFDVLGKKIATVMSGMKEAGEYSVAFDASSLSSGIYFYRLEAGRFVSTKKMTVIK